MVENGEESHFSGHHPFLVIPHIQVASKWARMMPHLRISGAFVQEIPLRHERFLIF